MMALAWVQISLEMDSSGFNANEIKHGQSPVVIVVLDPRYD